MDEFYRAPLSSAEAVATLAGLRALQTLCAGLGEALSVAGEFDIGVLETAASRIEGELPEFMTAQASRLAQTLAQEIRVSAGTNRAESEYDPDAVPPFPTGRTRRLLEDAWERDAPVEIEYFVASRGEWTNRRVEISDITDSGNGSLLSGQCGLRHEYRHFRLDHIRAVRVLDNADNEADPFSDDEPVKTTAGRKARGDNAEKSGGDSASGHGGNEPAERRPRRRRRAS